MDFLLVGTAPVRRFPAVRRALAEGVKSIHCGPSPTRNRDARCPKAIMPDRLTGLLANRHVAEGADER